MLLFRGRRTAGIGPPNQPQITKDTEDLTHDVTDQHQYKEKSTMVLRRMIKIVCIDTQRDSTVLAQFSVGEFSFCSCCRMLRCALLST